MAGGKAGPGRHEPGNAGRQCDRHPRRHRRALARPQGEALQAAQVVRRVAGARSGGRLGGGVQEPDLELVERDVECHTART